MSTDEMTHEEIVAYQDWVVDTAKEQIEKEIHLLPMVFVLTKHRQIDDWLKKTVLDTKTWDFPTEDAGDQPGSVILMIPVPYDNPHYLLKFIEYLSPSPEASTKQMEVLKNYGKMFFDISSGPETVIVNTFKKMFNVGGKDIIAAFVSKVCKTTEARAYVKVSEAWTLAAPYEPGEKLTMEKAKKARQNFPENFRDSPDAKEVVMSILETARVRRQVIWPFTRTVRETGKVSEWGKRMVKEDNGSANDDRLEGRFFNLLQRHLH